MITLNSTFRSKQYEEESSWNRNFCQVSKLGRVLESDKSRKWLFKKIYFTNKYIGCLCIFGEFLQEKNIFLSHFPGLSLFLAEKSNLECGLADGW